MFQEPYTEQATNNHKNNKYISRALNPSLSNLPEAQSAVHVQLETEQTTYSIKTKQTKKPSMSRKQKTNKQTKAGDGRVTGQGPNIK